MLELKWDESGGPDVKPPTRRGYGTRVITSGIDRQLGGKAHFNWRPSGLYCALAVPYDAMNAQSSSDLSDETPGVEYDDLLPEVANEQKKRILVVEDEPMISMMLADILLEGGHQVDGPHASIDEAMPSAVNAELQGAILDVNVRGENVYSIADILASRNIPFIFLTGYAADRVGPGFADVPVLQKPVEPERIWSALAKSLAVGSKN